MLKTQGLQRSKDNKGKMNEDLLKVSQHLQYYKVFMQDAEAAIQRCSIKRILKIAQNSQENLFAGISLLTKLNL